MNAMLSTRLESALVMTHHKRECGSDLFAIARRDDVTSAFARQHCADRSAQEFVPGIVALAARKRQDRHEAFLWNGLDQPGADTGQGPRLGVAGGRPATSS